jgi:hypothetical protein
VLQADIDAGAFPRDERSTYWWSNAFSNVRDFLALNFAPPMFWFEDSRSNFLPRSVVELCTTSAALRLRRSSRHEPAGTENVAAALFRGARPCHSRDVAGVVGNSSDSSLGLLTGFVEGWSLGDAVYFAFITGLTIGYGDLVPRQTLTRALAIGIGFFGLFVTALIAAIAVYAMRSALTDDGSGNE